MRNHQLWAGGRPPGGRPQRLQVAANLSKATEARHGERAREELGILTRPRGSIHGDKRAPLVTDVTGFLFVFHSKTSYCNITFLKS